MKVASGIVFLLLAACATAPLKKRHQGFQECRRTSTLVIFTRQGAAGALCEQSFRTAFWIQQGLNKSIFNIRNATPLKIYVYHDQGAYNSNPIVPVESLADYNIKSHEIHISGNASTGYWKHEISHALLENHMPGAPLWFHEGLAYFLQFQNFQTPLSCSEPARAALPGNLLAFLPLVKERAELPVQVALNLQSTPEELRLNTISSIYYTFYLWHRRQLLRTLNQGVPLRSSREPFRPDAGFKDWLRSDLPGKFLPGC